MNNAQIGLQRSEQYGHSHVILPVAVYGHFYRFYFIDNLLIYNN